MRLNCTVYWCWPYYACGISVLNIMDWCTWLLKSCFLFITFPLIQSCIHIIGTTIWEVLLPVHHIDAQILASVSCSRAACPFNLVSPLQSPKERENKYWNWCRCIQRKDSARVILTASWFNNINIGYRFHTSTVCHSCCNNVMYVVVLKLYIQGKSCVRSMQASAARLRPGSGILFMTYIDICIISVW